MPFRCRWNVVWVRYQFSARFRVRRVFRWQIILSLSIEISLRNGNQWRSHPSSLTKLWYHKRQRISGLATIWPYFVVSEGHFRGCLHVRRSVTCEDLYRNGFCWEVWNVTWYNDSVVSQCDIYLWKYICKTSRVVVTVFARGLSKRNCIVPVHQSASFSAYFIDFL